MNLSIIFDDNRFLRCYSLCFVMPCLMQVFLDDDEKGKKLNEEEETLTEQTFWKEGLRMLDDIEMKKLPPKTSKKKSIIDDDVPKFSLGISSLSL